METAKQAIQNSFYSIAAYTIRATRAYNVHEYSKMKKNCYVPTNNLFRERSEKGL